MSSIRYGIVGCGLIGKKRMLALGADKITAVCDTDSQRAALLKGDHSHIEIFSNYRELIQSNQVDAVIVSTINSVLSPVTKFAVEQGKPVIVEKPVAINLSELTELEALARDKNVPVRVGFNHRFHPALMKAKNLVEQGAVGPLMFLRARYGHGGRIGYDKEWRANPALSGGGELIDQGVHLIDLSSWFMGDFTSVYGEARTYFWDMPVDDNAFMHLKTDDAKTAWLHVSCSEWKNLFSMEIYGRTGKIQIDGLGGSYGVEKLTYYKMLPQMGPPETSVFEFPGEDLSWKREHDEFEKDILQKRTPDPGLLQACKVMGVVSEIYKQSETFGALR